MACVSVKPRLAIADSEVSGETLTRRLPALRLRFAQNCLRRLFAASELWAPIMFCVLVAYATVRAVATCVSSPLTFDDIFTITMARQPGLRALLHALWLGVDSQPPLFDLIERLASVLPKPEIAYRLPSVLAFDCMLVCVFLFVRRRAGTLIGLLCAAMLLLTPLYTSYAMAARPYCLAAACVAAALLAYQRASTLRWITFMGLALAAAECLHYFSIFALLPIAATEVARSRRTASVRAGVSMALAAGASPLVLFWPLLAHFRSVFGGHFWATPTLAALYHLFGNSLSVPGFWGLAIAVACAFALLAPLPLSRELTAEAAGMEDHVFYERILVFFVLVSPLMFFAAARLFHGPFDDRYILSSILAFPLAMGLILPTLHRRVCIALALLVLCALASNEISFWHADSTSFLGTPQPAAEAEAMIHSSGYPGLPVVVSDSHDYLQIAWYAGPQLKSRLAWTADPAAAVSRVGYDTDDRNLPLLAKVSNLKVYALQDFTASHREFLLYWAPGGEHGWLPDVLAHEGFSVTLLTSEPGHFLFLVSRRARAGTDAQGNAGRPVFMTMTAARSHAS